MEDCLTQAKLERSRWRDVVSSFLIGAVVSSVAWFAWHESKVNAVNARLEPWAKSEIALALFQHLGADVYIFQQNMAKRFWNGRGFDTLYLSGLNVTDSDLALIAGASDIQAMDLSGTKVTDECLSSLATLPDLKYLNVRNTKITSDGLQRFSRWAPRCQVNDPLWEESEEKRGGEKGKGEKLP